MCLSDQSEIADSCCDAVTIATVSAAAGCLLRMMSASRYCSISVSIYWLDITNTAGTVDIYPINPLQAVNAPGELRLHVAPSSNRAHGNAD